MTIIRLVIYRGPAAAMDRQLERSMAEGRREYPDMTITVVRLWGGFWRKVQIVVWALKATL